MTEPVPFTRLVRVELAKALDTRSGRWLAALVAVFAVAGVLACIILRDDIDQSRGAYLEVVAFAVSFLLPVVALLQITSEWSVRTGLFTHVLEPRRERLLGAKIVAGLLIGLAGAALATLAALAGLALADAFGRDIAWSGGDVHLGLVLFVLLNVLLGQAFGALMQSPVGGIVAIFAGPLVFGVLAFVWTFAQRWLDPARWELLLTGEAQGHWDEMAAVAGVWILVPLAAGVVRTLRREIV